MTIELHDIFVMTLIVEVETMKQKELQTLIEKTQEKIREFKVLKTTINDFKRTCAQLTNYFIEINEDFSPELADKWVEKHINLNSGTETEKRKYRCLRRNVELLKDYYANGSISWREYRFMKKEGPISEEYTALLETYLQFLKDEGMAQATIVFSDCVCRMFLQYLERCDIWKLQNLTPIKVKDFFSRRCMSERVPEGVRAYAYRLRKFLKYAADEQLINIKIPLSVPTDCAKHTKIITTISKKTESKLLSEDKISTPLGKRDHAMILLALRLGLRSSDVLNLKLNDVDWTNNTLSLVQQKTGEPLTLPLLPEVGNALADYILNGRPASSSSNIFLRTVAPFTKVTRSVCYESTVRNLKPDLNREYEQHGLHILRRTRASQMLTAGISSSVIASFLGHRNMHSIDVYLSTDHVNLRDCALTLEGIETTQEVLV